MKRQKHKVRRNNGRQAKAQPGGERPQNAGGAQDTTSRRDFLRTVGNRALIVVAVGGAGWYLVEEVRATIREEDLSRIGNGIPAIVQIHDPSCPTCTALQREAREAVCSLDDEKVQFLVANLNTEEGRRLATRHRVGKITLLLFDGEGNMRNVLAGPNSAENLKPVFARHAARYAQK